ncbi:NAD(P)H-binding protein, partial [Streptomyces syringium]|uniref:NAD(P)H-binding protein n=1 Tax=Streptomyces syringium TaxID=76729 RepID=UPI00345448AC
MSRSNEVTAVVRNSARLPQLPAAAEARVGDASDPEDVARLSAGQDVVIGATRPAPAACRAETALVLCPLPGSPPFPLRGGFDLCLVRRRFPLRGLLSLRGAVSGRCRAAGAWGGAASLYAPPQAPSDPPPPAGG